MVECLSRSFLFTIEHDSPTHNYCVGGESYFYSLAVIWHLFVIKLMMPLTLLADTILYMISDWKDTCTLFRLTRHEQCDFIKGNRIIINVLHFKIFIHYDIC